MTDDEERARDRRNAELDDLRWLMQCAQGRRIATRVLAQAGIWRTSFSTEPYMMAFKEGERNLGLWWKGELDDADPNAYLRMLKEFSDATR